MGILASLSVSSATPRLAYLDGWRGLAILFVLQSHFLPSSTFETGQLGVDIFFSLSGLLMSRVLFVERQALSVFYRRRIARVVPTFLLFVALVYGAAAFTGAHWNWGELVATLLFVRTYLPSDPDIWHTGLPIGHLWSLNVEEQGYMFFSFLRLPSWLRGREAWLLSFVAALTMWMFYHFTHAPQTHSSSFEIRTEVAGSFLLVSAAYQLLLPNIRPWLHVTPWMPLVALTTASVGYLPNSHWWVGALLSPLGLAFTVNHLNEGPRWFRNLLACAPLRMLGLWSYSIYLWQQPFFEHKADMPTGVACLGALATGLTSYYCWERPWRRKINGRDWSPLGGR